MFGLVELGNFLFFFSSTWVKPRFLTKNQPCIMPGSALKVCVVVVVNLVINFGYSLALAEPNNYHFC